MAIELGDIARDTVTGFEGVVMAKTAWLYGCNTIRLQPKELKDGKPVEAQSFDEPQLMVVRTAAEEADRTRVPAATAEQRRTGGPKPEPARGQGR